MKEYLLETTINLSHLRPSLSCFQLCINRNQKLYLSILMKRTCEKKKINLRIIGIRHDKLYVTFLSEEITREKD